MAVPWSVWVLGTVPQSIEGGFRGGQSKGVSLQQTRRGPRGFRRGNRRSFKGVDEYIYHYLLTILQWFQSRWHKPLICLLDGGPYKPPNLGIVPSTL